MELRRNQRYRLSAPVNFAAQCGDAKAVSHEGRTRDISRSGVFVLTREPLPESCTVSLDVILPTSQFTAVGARLQSRGHVVRSQQEGFAVRVDVPFRIRNERNGEQTIAQKSKPGGRKTPPTVATAGRNWK